MANPSRKCPIAKYADAEHQFGNAHKDAGDRQMC